METIRKTKKAMQINGQYLEDLIPGFSTLNVTGRERLGVEINTTQRGMDDGAVYNYKRYQSRTLTVSFIINCGEFYESSAALQALNKLNAVLDVEEAKFIFDDEPDKFYIGTPGDSSDIGISLGVASGTFDITCSTPYKYSVKEYTATAQSDGSFVISYNGSAKSYPILEADFPNIPTVTTTGSENDVEDMAKADCGYVSFFTEDKDIIQLGDPDEADTEEGAYSKSQTLLSQPFNATSYWNDTTKSKWTRTGEVALAKAFADVIVNPTSATVWSGWSYSEAPNVCHSLTLYSSNRRETSVDITAVMSTNLQYSGSWIGSGTYMYGHVYIGGSWQTITIKNGEYWSGTGTHTASVTFSNVSVTADQTSIGPIYFYVTTANDNSGQLGQVQCSNFAISSYGTGETDKYYIHPSTYSNNQATMTYSLPTDQSGAYPLDFHITWKQKFCISNSTAGFNQYGGVSVEVLDESNKMIARADIVKNYSGRNATVKLYAGPTNSLSAYLVKSYDIDCSYYNTLFGSTSSASKTCTITKSGGLNNTVISFEIAGKTTKYSSNISIARRARKVKITFSKTGSSVVAFNGIHDIKFIMDNCETTRDVANKFSTNDIVVADCSTGIIYLNEVATPSLGALGNDWETFYLKPGLNQIGTAYSDWVPDATKPTFKITYREVFL